MRVETTIHAVREKRNAKKRTWKSELYAAKAANSFAE